MSDYPSTAIVTAVMNRNEPLRYTLPSWLFCPGLREIIIVDWSSEVPAKDFVESIGIHPHVLNRKVRFIRVVDQKHWNASIAFNTAWCATHCDYILKLDADVLLTKPLLDHFLPDKGCYMSGNWVTGRDNNEKAINGSFCCRREHLVAIGGYDERYPGYGYEDTDLYNRLKEVAGLKQVDFDFDTVYHLYHSDITRTRYTTGTKATGEGQTPRIIKDHRRFYENRQPWTKANQKAAMCSLSRDDAGNETRRVIEPTA